MTKTAINTRTQEEYDALMRYYDERNEAWADGSIASKMNYWMDYEEDTCIVLDYLDTGLNVGDLSYFKNKAFNIIPYTEFAKANIVEEIDFKALYLEGREVIKKLSFAGQITGGTAGRDENLCKAIEKAEQFLKKTEDGQTRS